jgi:1-acyl-sn-glycerol-3-phosphate acyltransferase
VAYYDPTKKPMPDSMTARYRLFRAFMVLLGRLFFGFTVCGAEKVPREGPVILASNHHQYADPVLVCMAAPRRIWWMAKKEVFRGPILTWFFHFIGVFPVDREGGGRAALKTALTLLRAGWTLGLFPEGTRRRAGYSEESARGGVVMLAARSGAPIIPVYIEKIPTPRQRLAGRRLAVYIGNPITLDPEGKGRRYREAADGVLREIYALPERYAAEARGGRVG